MSAFAGIDLTPPLPLSTKKGGGSLRFRLCIGYHLLLNFRALYPIFSTMAAAVSPAEQPVNRP